ncbi:MAG: haloacid dehalogenase-like hydrolase [Lachnospiraceae bacterium]|nr:haloacid dehalogenase-like hydrolase [Lachnospiraceae bacterium]
MANIIAVIWDFDKTLVNGYMQDPIFEQYHVNSSEFWKEVNSLPQKYLDEQGVHVNHDTIYLNHFISCAQPGGQFAGLNNEKLREFGKKLNFYPGVPEIFSKTKRMIEENNAYQEYGIRVEHYIVSTGFKAEILGSSVMDYVDGVWGCELIEHEVEGERIISEIGYTIDNTSKTRAIFEINKGIPKHPEVDVNSKMPEELRRVRFENMIYIADGPSDIPAFSLVHKNGGSTFAIYPPKDKIAFRQVEQMRHDGRIDMYAEADYSEGTTAFMWISNMIKEYAERIYQKERSKFAESISSAPRHLTE